MDQGECIKEGKNKKENPRGVNRGLHRGAPPTRGGKQARSRAKKREKGARVAVSRVMPGKSESETKTLKKGNFAVIVGVIKGQEERGGYEEKSIV